MEGASEMDFGKAEDEISFCLFSFEQDLIKKGVMIDLLID